MHITCHLHHASAATTPLVPRYTPLQYPASPSLCCPLVSFSAAAAVAAVAAAAFMSTSNALGHTLDYTALERANLDTCLEYMKYAMSTPATTASLLPLPTTTTRTHSSRLWPFPCPSSCRIAYDPKRASAAAVSHLCAPSSRFIGQSTFPKAHSVPDYAEVHGEVMRSISDLQLQRYDVMMAKGDLVTLRYTASGSHTGEPWHGVAGNGAKATWHAVVIFELQQGKIATMFKEWDKVNRIRCTSTPAHATQRCTSAHPLRLLCRAVSGVRR